MKVVHFQWALQRTAEGCMKATHHQKFSKELLRNLRVLQHCLDVSFLRVILYFISLKLWTKGRVLPKIKCTWCSSRQTEPRQSAEKDQRLLWVTTERSVHFLSVLVRTQRGYFGYFRCFGCNWMQYMSSHVGEEPWDWAEWLISQKLGVRNDNKDPGDCRGSSEHGSEMI